MVVSNLLIHLRKYFPAVFLPIFCVFILFCFTTTKFTKNVIADNPANNNFEQKSGKTVNSVHLSNNQKIISVPKYVALPALDKFQTRGQFFVAPNGRSSGNGSIHDPWDLKTAISQPSSVKPGAIIWLRGGTYKIPEGILSFNSTLTGTPEEPIKVLSYPGEWAVIDGNLSHSSDKNNTIIINRGDYVWFMNFEITNTETSNRKINLSSSNSPKRRGGSIYDYATGTKIINLVIHDTGQGIGAWQSGQDNEYYGNIVYHNGWDAPDRLHGHGTYTQNKSGTKNFEDNIFFNPFGLNSRMGGTNSAAARNYTWSGNVFFNGRMAWDGPDIENLKVFNNYTYNNPLSIGSKIKPKYKDADIRNNYLMSGVLLFEFTKNVTFTHNTVWSSEENSKNVVIDINSLWDPAKFTIDNNIYYKAFKNYPYWQFKINYKGKETHPEYDGYYAFNKTIGSQQTTYALTERSWQDDLQIDLNSTYIDSVPDQTKIFIKPNKYDSNRFRIIIYNWKNSDKVSVNMDSMLSVGDSYELRNVQDYFRDSVSGVYQGGQLEIDMKNRTRVKPVGYNQVSNWHHDPLQPNTFPTFGVFVLIKTA